MLLWRDPSLFKLLKLCLLTFETLLQFVKCFWLLLDHFLGLLVLATLFKKLVDLLLLFIYGLLLLGWLLHQHQVPSFGLGCVGLDLDHLLLKVVKLLGLAHQHFEFFKHRWLMLAHLWDICWLAPFYGSVRSLIIPGLLLLALHLGLLNFIYLLFLLCALCL